MSPVTSVPGSSGTAGTADTTTHTRQPQLRQLPPLRTVLGPQLELPTPVHESGDPWLSRTSSTSSATDPSPSFGLDGMLHPSPRSPSRSEAQAIIPFPTNFSATDADTDTVVFPLSFPNTRIRHPSSHSAPLFSSRIYPPSPSSSQDHLIHYTVPQPPHSAPPHSAQHVLRPSPSGELITGPSIPRSRSRAATAVAAFGPSGSSASGAFSTAELRAQWERRHVCPLCKKRFNRPSSLKTHQSVHTGSRPFACSHPGCTKTFSVASNMRRHLRKHGEASELEHEHAHTSELAHDQNDPEPFHAQESSEGSGFGSGEGEMDGEYTHAPTSMLSPDTAVTSAHSSPSLPSDIHPLPTSQEHLEGAPSLAARYGVRSLNLGASSSGTRSESAPDAPGRTLERPLGGTGPRRTSRTP